MIAIIGATGKVGGATARELRNRGQAVRAVVRDRANAGEIEAIGCEIAVADVRDTEALGSAIAGADAVQVICPINFRAVDARAEFSAMIDSIVTALVAAKPRRILAISDYGAHLEIDTGITSTFHELEAKLGALPGEVIFLRSAEHMQNLRRVARAAIDTGVFPSLHHPLDKIFPTVSAYDVGAISADLLLDPNPPRIVHAEGPRRYRPIDVARMLTEITGREVRAIELPRTEWDAALLRGGLSPSYVELVTRLNEVHNTGAIDVEADAGPVRRGATDLSDVLKTIVQNA
jgi:uncharacterized protein YbjT (DUF2867 family)